MGFAEYGLMELELAACGLEALAGTDREKEVNRTCNDKPRVSNNQYFSNFSYIPEAEDCSCPFPAPGSPGNQASDWCWQACGCHGHWVGACCKLKTEEEGGAWASKGCSCLKQILVRQKHP